MVAAWPSSFSSSCRSASSACFALGAQPLLFLHRGAVALALLGRFFGVAAQPLQFQPRHREPRVGARQVVAQLAHLVIERHAVLLARLLQRAQPLQFGFERDDLLVQAVQPRHLLVERVLPRSAVSTASSRASRFMASGPAPVFLPPVTVWP